MDMEHFGVLRYSPIDFHCHGIGKFDFVEPALLSIQKVEKSLEQEGIRSIITLYVPRQKLQEFQHLLDDFHEAYKEGGYKHVVGIAVEGPMMASVGGTPKAGCWYPTKKEWEAYASTGEKGLKYIVLSVDPNGMGESASSDSPPNVTWILDLLLEHGIKPALGHFSKDNPEKTAAWIDEVLNYVERRGDGPIVTDHLFNDMPLNFKHAWRGRREKANRDAALVADTLAAWSVDNVEETMGPVPAALVRGAHRGLAMLCLNFDGEHVDLEVCKRAVEVIGAEYIMLMTDRIQSRVLGGQKLKAHDDTTLLYQENNIVAGGTSSVAQQIANMKSIGIDPRDEFMISCANASSVLGLKVFLD